MTEAHQYKTSEWEVVCSFMTESEQLLLVHVLSGRRVYVPAEFDLQNPSVEALVASIGAEATRKLCTHAGGALINIPSANLLRTRRQHILIRRLVKQGAELPTIAESFNLSERQVRRIVNGA